MASVAHHDAEVVLARELEGLANIGSVPDLDSVADVVAESARLCTVRKRIAALVGEAWLHDGGGRGQAGHSRLEHVRPEQVRDTLTESRDWSIPSGAHRMQLRRMSGHGRVIRWVSRQRACYQRSS